MLSNCELYTKPHIMDTPEPGTHTAEQLLSDIILSRL